VIELRNEIIRVILNSIPTSRKYQQINTITNLKVIDKKKFEKSLKELIN
jgi:hypothetical protein